VDQFSDLSDLVCLGFAAGHWLEVDDLADAFTGENVVAASDSFAEAFDEQYAAEVIEADVGVGFSAEDCCDDFMDGAHGLPMFLNGGRRFY